MKLYFYYFMAALMMFAACSQSNSQPSKTADVDITYKPEPVPEYPKHDKQLSAEAIKKLITEAEKERNKAAKLTGHQWRFTSKFIKESKEMLEKGKLADSQKLAERALYEGRMAQWQAKESAQTWMMSVPK